MTMSGLVDDVDVERGIVTVCSGTNRLGYDVSGTAELALPGRSVHREAVAR